MSKNNNRHRWNKRKNHPTQEQPPFEVGKVWGAPKERNLRRYAKQPSLHAQQMCYTNKLNKYLKEEEYDGDTIIKITCRGRHNHIIRQIQRTIQLRRNKGEWETS